MKAFRISCYHRITEERLVAIVYASSLENAYFIMGKDYKRMSCEYEVEL